MKRASVAFVIAAALPLVACEKKIVVTTDTASAAPAVADASIPAVRAQWKAFSEYIVKSAEMMPEADYAFKPVKTVRSFGEIIGHVAGSQKLICATALGDTPPAEDAVEKAVHTKAELIAALKESNDYCAKAYDMQISAAGAAVDLFGSKDTKFGALALNATHDGEHYGNIVTYMRIKGMVPPSSAPAPTPAAAVVPKDTAKK